MRHTHDAADAKHAVRLLGRMLPGPTAGAFAAPKRLARYLAGRGDALN